MGCRVEGGGRRVWATWSFSIQDLLRRNVKRFRGGLVFKAHRLLHHSILGLRVMKKKRRDLVVLVMDDLGGEAYAHTMSRLITSGGRTPLGRSSQASLRKTGVRSMCGPISPYSGRDCAKSHRSSYTGL